MSASDQRSKEQIAMAKFLQDRPVLIVDPSSSMTKAKISRMRTISSTLTRVKLPGRPQLCKWYARAELKKMREY